MKKIIFALLISVCGVSPVLAQDLTVIPETTRKIALPSTDQLPYQQLIGYAIEVSSTAYTDGTPVGSYTCSKIYSTEGYNELPKYPCELIVHSKKGPIVVRYQDVSSDMDAEIKEFLSENQLGSSLYYNKGRFRFEVGDDLSKE